MLFAEMERERSSYFLSSDRLTFIVLYINAICKENVLSKLRPIRMFKL